MQAPYTSKQQPPRAGVESSGGGLVIGQLNSLRARAEAGEAEGGDTAATFNFKCLLRQSAVLPTGEPGHVATRDNTRRHAVYRVPAEEAACEAGAGGEVAVRPRGDSHQPRPR